MFNFQQKPTRIGILVDRCLSDNGFASIQSAVVAGCGGDNGSSPRAWLFSMAQHGQCRNAIFKGPLLPRRKGPETPCVSTRQAASRDQFSEPLFCSGIVPVDIARARPSFQEHGHSLGSMGPNWRFLFYRLVWG